jgi:RNA polymerase sigma factor (sigma-70 family)
MRSQTTNGRRLSLTACTAMMAASLGGAAWGDSAAPVPAEAVDRITRYCDASWRNARIAPADWADCTQDVFLRLLERCSAVGLEPAIEDPQSSERRELNRSIWATAQRWRRASRPAPLNEGSVSDHRAGNGSCRAELRSLLAADCLSERQRRILAMYADGHSVSEIADALGLSPARVSDEKYKAVAKLARNVQV